MWSCPHCGADYEFDGAGRYECNACQGIADVDEKNSSSWGSIFVWVIVALVAARAGPHLLDEGRELWAEGGDSIFRTLGFADFDDDIAACYSRYPVESYDTIRRYEFEFDGWIWEFELEFDSNLYGCLASPQIREGYGRFDYKQYVTAEFDDIFMEELVDSFREVQRDKGYDDRQLAEMILSFVQELTYATDDVTSPYDEWPRFPEETLFVQGGDCEDTAILYSSLILAMGYGAALVEMPGHMASAIPVERSYEGGWQVGNTFWAFVETTGSGWRIGDIPPELQNKQGKLVYL